MSKAIAALVRLGPDGQESRKREFFKKLNTNLANDDPGRVYTMSPVHTGRGARTLRAASPLLGTPAPPISSAPVAKAKRLPSRAASIADNVARYKYE